MAGLHNQATYDLFMSYAHADGERVRLLVDALRKRGVRVWFDETEIADFESITRSISLGLANAKALVAFYSDLYPTRRACQWELTAAFIAAQHEGDPRRRIFVVNPESHTQHICPIELRDALFMGLASEHGHEDIDRCAAAIQDVVAQISGVISDVHPLVHPTWYGTKGLGSNRFVGRVPALWDVHSALFADEVAVITAQTSPGCAQLRGMGGVGKSLLAEEYALRFGAAHPGGIFVLKGASNRDDQLANFAAHFGLDVKGLDAKQIEGWLVRKLGETHAPYLWLVDDLPGGLEEEERRRWLAPTRRGKTLITTRSRAFGSTASVVDLGALEPEEGYDLLTKLRKPHGVNEEQAGRDIVEELGGLALAIDVAGGLLAKLLGWQTFEDFLAGLRTPEVDSVLDDLAAKLKPDLPNGHERSIAITLRTSIDALDPAGQDFLRLASALAKDVIPCDLIGSVFAKLGHVSSADAASAAEAAVVQCLAESVEANSQGGYSVHALVRSAVRAYDEDAARRSMLSELAVRALNEMLPQVGDARSHKILRAHVAHARHLAKSPSTEEEATLLLWIGLHEFERGAFQSARGFQETTLKARRALLGEGHTATLAARNNLSVTMCVQGDLAGARQHQEAVLYSSLRLVGEEHPDTLTVRNNLALTLLQQGDLESARAHQEAVWNARRRVVGDAHPDTLCARQNLAGTLRAQGDFRGARMHHEEALRGLRTALDEEHPRALMCESQLALTLYAQGDFAGATQHGEAVLNARSRLLSENHPDTMSSRSGLGMILAGLGDLRGARAHEEAVLASRYETF